MLVNGSAISNIELIERVITNQDIANIVENTSTLLPSFSDRNEYNLGSLNIRIGFYESSLQRLENLKSKVILQLSNCTIKFDDMDYYFKLAFQNKFEGDEPFEDRFEDRWYQEISFTFIILDKYISEKSSVANKILSISINCDGALKTPCIIEITPTADMIDFSITGLSNKPIKLLNLKANIKVIVDGEAKKVFRNGANDFINTDMWDYPKLQPGVNTITFSKNLCNVSIKYKSRFN